MLLPRGLRWRPARISSMMSGGFSANRKLPSLPEKRGQGLSSCIRAGDRLTNPDVIEDQFMFLNRSLKIAGDAGIEPSRIVLDPGFGFGKERDEDIALMARMSELQAFGFPLLVGTSRKRFVGAMTGQADPRNRDIGTAATSVALRLAGADIFRVHNVAFNRDALAVADAILQSNVRIQQ